MPRERFLPTRRRVLALARPVLLAALGSCRRRGAERPGAAPRRPCERDRGSRCPDGRAIPCARGQPGHSPVRPGQGPGDRRPPVAGRPTYARVAGGEGPASCTASSRRSPRSRVRPRRPRGTGRTSRTSGDRPGRSGRPSLDRRRAARAISASRRTSGSSRSTERREEGREGMGWNPSRREGVPGRETEGRPFRRSSSGRGK